MENSGTNSIWGGCEKRESNFELLRIVAMFMIIVFHIVKHCVIVQMSGGNDVIQIANTVFDQPVFYKKLFLLNMITPWGQIGNAIFLLISGYFLLSGERQIHIFKIAKKLLLQLGFAAITLVLVSAWICSRCHGQALFRLYNIKSINSMSWYVGYYFVVILLAALFLNKFLRNRSRAQFSAFLIAMFAIVTFSWSRGLIGGVSSRLITLAVGVFCYALGGYIRKYDPFQRVRLFVFFLVPFVIYVFMYISARNTAFGNIADYYNDLALNGGAKEFVQKITTYGNYSFIVLVIAVCLFEVFRRIKMPRIGIINFFAQATFMVYLVHDNKFFYGIWGIKDWVQRLYDTPMLFLYDLAKWALATFVCGVATYVVYLLVAELFRRTKWVFLKNAKE